VWLSGKSMLQALGLIPRAVKKTKRKKEKVKNVFYISSKL
jgi:hypothetical protein